MAFARATASSSGAVWPDPARADTVQPLADRGVVRFGDAYSRVNAVQQGLSGMTGGHPGAVSVGDLVIAEAEREGWADEAEGLKVSLARANEKLAQADTAAARRTEAVHLGIPACRDIAAATLAAPGDRHDR